MRFQHHTRGHLQKPFPKHTQVATPELESQERYTNNGLSVETKELMAFLALFFTEGNSIAQLLIKSEFCNRVARSSTYAPFVTVYINFTAKMVLRTHSY